MDDDYDPMESLRKKFLSSTRYNITKIESIRKLLHSLKQESLTTISDFLNELLRNIEEALTIETFKNWENQPNSVLKDCTKENINLFFKNFETLKGEIVRVRESSDGSIQCKNLDSIERMTMNIKTITIKNALNDKLFDFDDESDDE